LRRQPTFSIIFFGERRARSNKRKKHVSNEIN